MRRPATVKWLGVELTHIRISEKIVVGALEAEEVDEPERYLAGKISRRSNREL